MRILILLRDRSLNGISTYNRILARALSEQGHELCVWPSDASADARRAFRLPLLHPCFEPLLRWRLRDLRPEVVLVNHYTQARLAHRLRETTGTPWVAVMHNGHAAQRMAEWARLFGNAAGVVTMCETLRARYAALVADSVEAVDGKRPPVLLSRLPIEAQPARTRAAGAPLSLGYCSRLSGLKGPRCEAWLQAIASLPERDHCKVLVIGGGSHLKQLRRVASDLGLRAEFTGMVDDPGRRLAEVDVITGAGYSLMEGLVRGCAAVALGFGGCFGALTEDNLDEAFAVNFGDHSVRPYPSDAAAIAGQLRIAIDSLPAVGASRLRERIVEHFSPAPIAADLVRFLGRVATVES
jgi:glycosyltransferase involved in cell wall biosynthesis